MAIVLGLDAILMRGPAGSTGSTEVKNVKDLTLNLESGDRRHDAGHKGVAGVGRDFERGVFGISNSLRYGG